MINFSQVAALWFNSDDSNLLSVVDFDITINVVDRFIKVDFTCECNYNDDSPVFAFFIQRQPGTINLTIKDNSTNDGGTRRTIKLEKAMITSYRETYNSQEQSAENRNVYFIVFSIHADTVNLGSASLTAFSIINIIINEYQQWEYSTI